MVACPVSSGGEDAGHSPASLAEVQPCFQPVLKESWGCAVVTGRELWAASLNPSLLQSVTSPACQQKGFPGSRKQLWRKVEAISISQLPGFVCLELDPRGKAGGVLPHEGRNSFAGFLQACSSAALPEDADYSHRKLLSLRAEF